MAHHQHHGLPHTGHGTQSPDLQRSSAAVPLKADDELTGEADEPPDDSGSAFRKTSIPSISSDMRKQSLLTRALHTDSESHDDSEHAPAGFQAFVRQTSRSSTCSTYSARTEFTSDEGLVSSGTHASSPNSPPRATHFTKPDYLSYKPVPPTSQAHSDHTDPSQSPKQASASGTSEPAVEAGLGRKRCITFSCGRQTAKTSAEPTPEPKVEAKPAEPAKRPCMIKFACPSKLFTKGLSTENKPCASRRLSPPPPSHDPSPSPSRTPDRRIHRDSDTTIKCESPKGARRVEIPSIPISTDIDNEGTRSEAVRFHEFASSDEEIEEWTQESTCHKSKLTIADTLEKEKAIQQLGEEAEEEALEEENAEADFTDDDPNDDELLDDVSDGGFQTDDEEGFAESDDSDDGDSDYEWWAPKRRTRPVTGTMLPNDTTRPHISRTGSDSSIDAAVGRVRARYCRSPAPRSHKKSRAIPKRPPTPELPDSTDFVCGTLDEDRPLEDAYTSCMEQRKLAKHRPTAQDIDPTFPTSDPDMNTDDEDDDDLVKNTEKDSDVEEEEDDEPRGRRRATPVPGRSPHPSPKRLRSPAPTAKASTHGPPMPSHTLFGQSARHVGIRNPGLRLRSPPPSRHTSPDGTRPVPMPAQRFLAQRDQLTHTTSLPRSPNPFAGRACPTGKTSASDAVIETTDDEHTDTGIKENYPLYSRGAIDIVQGLERKRLRRRQKFMEKYHRKEEKKRERGEVKRPQPGKGAERMRQVGIECAVYRDKRVLSV
ncbi:MAG: hypothetical protein M1828_004749 [Chrysothrix sp. TS-e1954]|nr:MAG: hypothetical protein M1828_004749 [Chrysothrix sp. TS-e1954]